MSIGSIGQHTKTNPLEDFLKNVKAMHNITKQTPTMNTWIKVQMKTLQETSYKKAHNTMTEIYRVKET